MNKIGHRVKTKGNGSGNGAIKKAIKKVEAGQRDEKIEKIYEKFKDNSLIKWKDSIKELVGIKAPDKPGMDI